MPLSPREQQILARIEQELDEHDPALAAEFTRPMSALRQSLSLWRRSTSLLILALLAQIVLHPLAVALGPAGVGILAAVLIVPWMVTAARTTGRRGVSRRIHRRHG